MIPARSLAATALAFLASLPHAVAQKPSAKTDTTPTVRYTIPLLVPTGAKTRVALRGKNLATVKTATSATEGVKVKFVAARKAAPPNNYSAERMGDSEVDVEVEVPKGATEAVLTVGDVTFPLALAEGTVAETEPNDGFTQAQEIAVPSVVRGVIQREKDVDVFRVAGRAGQTLHIEVEAAKLGSPLDAMLTLYDANGQVIQAVDDTPGSADPSLAFTLPRDGAYLISVMDAGDLGHGAYGYRLRVSLAKP